jgi:signal transduction histidine kinase
MAVYKTLFANLTKDRFYLVRRVIIAFVFVFSVVIAIIYLWWSSFNSMKENQKLVEHTHQELDVFETVLATLKDAEAGQRGFIITGDTTFLGPYARARDSFPSQFNRLTSFVQSDTDQLHLLDSLRLLISHRMSILENVVDLKKRSSLGTQEYALLYRGKALMDSISEEMDRAEKHESVLLQKHNERAAYSVSQSRITIIILTFMVLAILFISLITILSELKKRAALEELLKSVLDASKSGILSFQSIRNGGGKIIDFKFIQANLTSYLLTDAPPDSFIGKTFLEIDLLGQAALSDQYVSLVESGQPLSKDYHYTKDGRDLWVHLEAVKLADGFTLTFDNISKEKRTEFDLHNYLMALRRSNRELEEFAYVASHDLQEPLRKILSFIDRLRLKSYDTLNADSRTYIDRIINSATRMRTLINDLLTYSRAGRTEAGIVKVDLNVLVRQILSDLEVIIQQKNATVITSDLPVIESTEVQMQQLFQNLISNALKFSDKSRTPLITIHSEYLRSASGISITGDQVNESSWCRLTISDNGIGFENQYANRILELFQRLHGRSEYEGTGIGLAICKKIVNALHGTIVAQGNPGQGAIFTILLPLHQRHINDPQNDQAIEAA